MWSADEVVGIRRRLGLSQGKFARLLGVDAGTVGRWESSEGPRPKGAPAEVLGAISEQLQSEPKQAARLVKILGTTAAVGGLGYLILELLRRALKDDNEKPG